jgi:diguanylate cyclase (GGDEF)-like protein
MDSDTTSNSLDPMAGRYGAILRIGEALASSDGGEEELYALLHRELSSVLALELFQVSDWPPDSPVATLVYRVGPAGATSPRLKYSVEENPVLLTGRGVLVADMNSGADPEPAGWGAGENPGSVISVPLRSRGRILGSLAVGRRGGDAFTPGQLGLVQGAADIVAPALANIRHERELAQTRREAIRIEEISRALASSLDTELVLTRVVQAALDLLRGDGVVVWLHDGDVVRVAAARGTTAPHVGTEIPVDSGLVRRVLEAAGPLVLDAAPSAQEDGPRLACVAPGARALVVPLQGGDQVIGALSVTGARGRDFRPGDARLLERLAGHAAVAMENARLHSALHTLSLTDPLTRLPNRRQLDIHLSREFAAAQRGRALSVVLFDVDSFKEYNDTAGHVAGDSALEALARIMADETRAMNLVARYGGDEFLAVLSDTDLEGAERHADRIHRRVLADPFLSEAGLTLSSGAAVFDEDMDRVEDLIRAADRDMYRAKGENREDA